MRKQLITAESTGTPLPAVLLGAAMLVLSAAGRRHGRSPHSKIRPPELEIRPWEVLVLLLRQTVVALVRR